MKFPSILASFLLLVAGGFALGDQTSRTWTSSDGKTLEAQLVGADTTSVRLKLKSGQISTVPLSRLSDADRKFVAEWDSAQKAGGAKPASTAKPPPATPVVRSTKTMPDSVGVDLDSIVVEEVTENKGESKYLYRTTNYEFESEGKLASSLLREIARDFEATHALLQALPWQIDPKPPGMPRYKASLFENRNNYLQAGGPANSGGVYSSGEKRFKVPFESLGLKQVGSAYRMDRQDFDTTTIVHELTHQQMHFWLRCLPQWLVEGTAEYCGALPVKTGKFRVSGAKSALKDHIDFLKKRTRDGVPEPYPLDKLFEITNEQWNNTLAENPANSHRLYFTSYLLVYYFMHLDGKGDGELILKYFDAVRKTKQAYEDYEMALVEFRKKPEVKYDEESGAMQYPRSLKAPEMPEVMMFDEAREKFEKENLAILLNGRTEQALSEEIRSAFRKLAIRL